ncbi:MAG: hypothetical protein J6X39_02410 [Bacteroidales bacterium]|nr:hypothetical protein [Bacteroidales bacterium]
MKKILLAIFGAALLMVGCTKEIQTAVNDLNSRVSALETQVAANKAAIEKLQAGAVIQSVAQTATGWTITLSNNDVLVLYNGTNGTDGTNGQDGAPGKDGADGDSFFSSVEVDGDTVIIKLVDGTTFVLPLYVEFGLELLTEDAVLKASATTAIPYRVNGATPETKLHVVAGGNYTAKVSENSPEILITAPAVLTENSIVVMADRGDGKVSVKTINIVGQELEVSTTFARTAYFWSDSFNMKVASNVRVTFSSDVPWLTFEGTKATEEYEVTVKVAVTPSCKARTGHVIVKDPEGNIVQDLAVTQDGCTTFFLNNQKGYATWAEAATALATATADGQNIGTDGSVQIIISQDAELDRIVLPANEAIKSLVIKPRFYGVPAADPSKVVIKGLTIPGGLPTTIQDLVIRPDGTGILDNLNPTYGTGIAIYDGDNVININNVTFDGTDPAYTATTPTMIFDKGSKAGSVINITNCHADFGGCRGFQLYGAGKYTIDHNTLANAYKSYMGRLYATVDVTLTNNLIDTAENVFNLYVVGPTVTPAIVCDADCKLTSEDSNTYSDKVVRLYTGKTQIGEGGVHDEAGEKSVYPAVKGGSGIVTLGVIKYPTVSAALSAATNGAVIEVAEGEIDDNIKIPAGKSVTIKGAPGASRDKVIINGNIEIAGSVVLQDLTLKTKEGVTNNVLTVADASDGYNWGHNYLARVEAGASNVVLNNVHLDATLANADFKSSMSMLWISQASNIQVLNCTFDADPEGCYCPNQTHDADVLWSGNVFNGLGKKEWVIRVMDRTYATLTGNEFSVAGEAIQLYSDFNAYKGALILGDGVNDDNIYGPAVTKAVSSVYTMADYLFAGVTIKPSSIAFNAPTTAPARDPEIVLLWKHIDDADWNATVDIANVRNFAMNNNGMYLPQTAGHIYTLSLEDGSVIKDQEIAESTGGHWPGYCGAYSLSDGTIVLASGAINANAHFKVSTYDGSNFTPVADFINDGTYRLGDHITAAGTKDDFTVYAVDYKKGKDDTGRYLAFNYKGTALTVPTDSVKISGLPSNANMCEMTPFAAGKYYMQLEGGKDDMILTDGEAGATAAAITLGDLNADVNKRMTRGAKFFTAGGKNYMGFVEFINYDGGNGRGGRVHIYALPTNNPEVDLVGAKAVATYDLPTDTGSGNACASFMVNKVGAKVYLGVGLRSAGVALLEFKY